MSRDADLAPDLLSQHKAELHELLRDLLTPLASWSPAGQPAQLVSSAVRLIGVYGKWMHAEAPQLLQARTYSRLTSKHIRYLQGCRRGLTPDLLLNTYGTYRGAGADLLPTYI